MMTGGTPSLGNLHIAIRSQSPCTGNSQGKASPTVNCLGFCKAPTIHLDLSEKVVLLVEHLQGLVEETLKYAVGVG